MKKDKLSDTAFRLLFFETQFPYYNGEKTSWMTIIAAEEVESCSFCVKNSDLFTILEK